MINDSYWLQQEPYFIDRPESRERMSIQRWNDILLNSDQKVYALKDTATQAVVGVIVLEIHPHEEYAKFGVFAISKIHQGRNLGEILIDHVEKVARSLLKKSMRIEVFTFAHHLETYYQKLGYVYTGRTNSFFHADCIKPEFKEKASQYLKELEKKL
jgi:GNAT superfamily N-acetyltransferase